VDLEWDENNSFLYSISLIQIATKEYTFLVDPYPIHQHLSNYLKTIFEDDQKIKIFHDHSNDILKLQCCLHIYPTGVIDTQAVHSYLNKTKEKIGFKKLAEIHLGNAIADNINKDIKWADFRARIHPPQSEHFLPPELEKYGPDDAHLLFRIWNYQKKAILNMCYEENLHPIAVHKSIHANIRHTLRATFKNRNFHSYVKRNHQISTQHIPKFTSDDEMQVWNILTTWRMDTAKFYDTSTNQVLSVKDMKLITKALPTNSMELLNCLKHIPGYIRRFGIETFVSKITTHFDDNITITKEVQPKSPNLQLELLEELEPLQLPFDEDLPPPLKVRILHCFWCRGKGHFKINCTYEKNEFLEDFKKNNEEWEQQKDRRLIKRKIRRTTAQTTVGEPAKVRINLPQ